MKVLKTPLPGVLEIEPVIYKDERGFFLETYQQKKYREGGIQDNFLQDNHSKSGKNTLRGLHAQVKKSQAKLVRVTEGEVWDVAVDIRPTSATFKKWFGSILSAENHKQLYIPKGFAHGFCVLSEVAQVEYKCSEIYDPRDEISILWSDPTLSIKWPLASPIVSKKDQKAPVLDDLMDRLSILSSVSS